MLISTNYWAVAIIIYYSIRSSGSALTGVKYDVIIMGEHVTVGFLSLRGNNTPSLYKCEVVANTIIV